MKLLITGGAGYIGSHAVKEMLDQGHEVTVLDNLSTGHREAVDSRATLFVGGTGDLPLLLDIFQSQGTDAVMHFAANIEVGESVTDPGKYYRNNFSNTMILLEAAKRAGIRKFVFSSTAAVYGNPKETPIREDQEQAPINPYGRSKLMVEWALHDLARAHGFAIAVLRYFNVAGAHPSFRIGEDHRPESHLIPRILKGAQNEHEIVKIYGTDYPTPDGTCIRDYVHVMDLVQAHALALEKLEEGKVKTYNLGSEKGFSVREVIAACEKITGRTLTLQEQERRPGDPAVLVASSEKIRRELDWKPQYPDLETIVSHAWTWHQSHPDGYQTKKMSMEQHKIMRFLETNSYISMT